MTRKILLASDHAGYDLKQHLLGFLSKNAEYTLLDLGTNSPDSVDYPDFGQKAAKAILNGDAETGIVICGTGIGISIAANRFKGIRCTPCSTPEMAELARLHNDANLVALGGRFTTNEEAEAIVTVFLNTEFEGGRHINRVIKIDQ